MAQNQRIPDHGVPFVGKDGTIDPLWYRYLASLKGAGLADVKAWAFVTFAAGVPSIAAGFGVASVTDSGVGITDINLETPFSSGNYGSLVTAHSSAARMATTFPTSASVIRVRTFDSAGGAADLNFTVVAFGAQ